jgi:hypothetical protein
VRRLVLLAAAAAAACVSLPDAPPAPLVRHGPERLAVPYDDPRAADKRVLFDRINRDRAQAGVDPVAYEPRGALVGDLFCLDAALAQAWGHWDLHGRAPYLRWALAGGLDFHAQNAAMFSVTPGPIDRPLAELLLRAHDAMMAEEPPNDGHRRTVLDPRHTHVGIGMAVVGGEFRMSEEFTSVAFEWIEVPPGPLRAGAWAGFRGRPRAGWDVGLVEVRHEPPPRPLTLAALRERASYRYPPVIRHSRPRAPRSTIPGGADRGDAETRGGEVRFEFPLDHGPGYYYVMAYVHPEGRSGEELRPATAAMITAVP